MNTLVKSVAVLVLLNAISRLCTGQDFVYTKGNSYLYFKNSNHKHAVYSVGDILTFTTNDSNTKVSEPIVNFEDSLIVFNNFKINPSKISSLYVDEKTKNWFVFRYKYEQAFLLSGVAFFPVDFVNTRRVNPKSLIISGGLLGAGFMTKLIISRRLKVSGRRSLTIISY